MERLQPVAAPVQVREPRVEGVEVNREEGDGAFDYFSEDIMTQSRHLPGDGTWMPPESTC